MRYATRHKACTTPVASHESPDMPSPFAKRFFSLLTVVACVGLLGASAACSAPGQDEQGAEPTSSAALIVPASKATTDALGITEWQILSADVEGIHVVGVDERRATRSELTMRSERREPDVSVLVADIKAPEATTLRFEVQGESAISSGDDPANAMAASRVLEQLKADVETFESAPTTPAQLTGSSLTPQQLVSRDNPVYNGPICLLDQNGVPCAGVVLQTLGAGAQAILTCATLFISRGRFGKSLCAAGIVQAAGGVVQMGETKCAARFCKEMKR